MTANNSKKLLLERAAVLGAAAGVLTAAASLLALLTSGKHEIVVKAEPAASQKAAESAGVLITAAEAKHVDTASPSSAKQKRNPSPVVSTPRLVQIQTIPAPPIARRAVLRSRDYNVYLREEPSPEGKPIGLVRPDEFMWVVVPYGDYYRVMAGGKMGYIRAELVDILDGDGLTAPPASSTE